MKGSTGKGLKIAMSWDRQDAPPDPAKVQEANDAIQPRLGGKPAKYNKPRTVCYALHLH